MQGLQLSSLDMNKIFFRSDVGLTTNSSADSDGKYLLLLRSVNKDVALGSLTHSFQCTLSRPAENTRKPLGGRERVHWGRMG